MKTLLLVDGSSYLYRAFHALPDLRNRNNEPTGAVYGVLNMLRRLRKETAADYIACVFDAKGKTFRDDWYAEYKANRPPMPEQLVAQIEPLHQSVRAMGWPLLMVEGVEADDVIGTLAKQAETKGVHTVISTGDKDITQLVSPKVRLVNTMSNENLDEKGVEEKFGVKPEQMVDYLTLIGDSVDNVPGVEKVGPKTAVKWLKQYGTLDQVVAHADEIAGVVGENLRKALDWLPQAKKLLTIKCDVELPMKLEDLAPQSQDTAKLAELFDRLEFKSWLKELQARGPGHEARGETESLASSPHAPDSDPDASRLAPRASSTRDYQTVLTEHDLKAWLSRVESAELASIDTETTALDPLTARLVGISLSVEPHHAAYIPVGHNYAGALEQLPLDRVLTVLKEWMQSPKHRKVGQNLKYDKHVFANHGVLLSGIEHDTLLQSYVLESHQSHDMDSLAARHLGVKTISYDEVTGKGGSRIPFEQVALERATEYSGEDADVTLQLHLALYPQIERDQKLDRVYRGIEMPAMEVLFAMERQGVLLDSALLEQQSRELGEKMIELENRVHQEAGQPFNLNSPRQLQEILFERKGLPVKKKTPGGQPSTDEDVLQELALDHPLPKLILEYRGLAKLKSTYTDKLPKMVNPATGRVHTNYAQAVAVTGRLASNDPNLQNIPVRTAEGRRIREAFIAPPGSVIVSADYSQIELRIMAHLSQDKSLLKAFAAGEDVHRHTASEIFGVDSATVASEQRRYAKVINFGLIYGMSAFGLASQLGIERSAAQQYMERYFQRYPGVKEYMERTRETARNLGYVETVFGRRLYLAEIKSSNGARRQGAERAAINAPMQGTAADLIKLAMIAVHNWIATSDVKSRLIMQVHDELVLEVPERELDTVKKELPKLMGNVAKLDVPLVVDVGAGPNWEKAH
ncbi:MAG TPA: DNA polymerase I [Burkholderiales bacterium]|jgi:DNA polymerase-1|nr:DNA polymerase I [Burkholderiales bacterium]